MVLFTVAVYLFSSLYGSSTRVKALESLETGGRSLLRISLLLLSGLFLGSFVGTFLSRELVSRLLGEESGFKGILLGTVFGAAMPGGPYVLFPIVSSRFSQAHPSLPS
jgi:uncharacterized membrane protein YraQ (UPF0718 family)